MKLFLITLIAIVLCSAAIFICAPDLFSQTSRGMKITVRSNTGEEIELYKASYALIVGNGNYRNGWDPLPGATRDVQEVAKALKTHDFNVTLKTDLTKDKFEDAFETFVQNGKNEDARLLFYYAGHGYTEALADGENLGYLVMVDAPLPKSRGIDGSKSVDMESLVTQSRRMQSRHVLFVFDSCFSGTILNARSQIPPPHVSNNVKYPVRQFITAGRADETVPDHSVFKQAFLNLLEGRAREPIADGYITGAELGLYLKTEVPKYNRGQNPQYGKINNPKLNQGDFVFVLPREVPPPPGEALSTIATLNVTSTPSGATVYLNGIVIGKTPLRGYQIETGVRRQKQVELGVEFAGSTPQVRSVTLKGGQEVPWDVQLETQATPQQGVLTSTTIIGKDGAEMVLIPAGDFQMGSDARDDEKPVHTVYVDAFYIHRYLVTNAQFKAFVDANPQWQKDNIPDKYHDGDYLDEWTGNSYLSGRGNDPVVCVSWYAAMAYAQWAGKRLPTEAEWEKAARGGLAPWSDRNANKYPWGDRIDANKANYDANLGDTTSVGRYPPNGYGLYDMAGNVWEWCIDEYDAGFYRRSPRRNPLAGEMTLTEVMTHYQNVITDRVLRGGAWDDDDQDVQVVYRAWDTPTSADERGGFRCARAVTPATLPEKQALNQISVTPDVTPDVTEMVLIPAGEFQIGGNDDWAEDNEKPVHTVYLDAFYMDKYEVTNAQFKAFVDANPQWEKNNIPDKYHDGDYLNHWLENSYPSESQSELQLLGGLSAGWSENSYPSGEGNHPVVFVSWYAVMAYAQWAGKRLPTEAEWEKAARGGLVDKKYPWGNAIDSSKANYGWKVGNTALVGGYAPNGYGLHDMAGNVWEWCLDAYDEGFYARSPRRNPLAGEMTLTEVMAHYQNVTTSRVLRGGSWSLNAQYVRVANRYGLTPSTTYAYYGFRCVRDVTP